MAPSLEATFSLEKGWPYKRGGATVVRNVSDYSGDTLYNMEDRQVNM